MASIEDRITSLEKQIDVLTRAVHLLTVSAKPTSEWLEKSMKKTVKRNQDYPGMVNK